MKDSEKLKGKKSEDEFDEDVAFGTKKTSNFGLGDEDEPEDEETDVQHNLGNNTEQEEGEQNRNRSGAKGYRDSIIDRLDLPDDFVYEEFPKKSHVGEPTFDDPANPDYKVNADPSIPSGKAYGASTQASPDSIVSEENKPFCREHEIDEGAIRRNEKMKLNQSSDATADATGEESY